MWWCTWTAYVEGWWKLSKDRTHSLFVTFEAMKQDSTSVVRLVAEFLGVRPLSDAKLTLVVENVGASEELHRRIAAWCADRMEGGSGLPGESLSGPHVVAVADPPQCNKERPR